LGQCLLDIAKGLGELRAERFAAAFAPKTEDNSLPHHRWTKSLCITANWGRSTSATDQ
jgi:hypothetical protein